MSNPENAAAQDSASVIPAATEPTFEGQVNEVVKQMVKGEDGNWTLPEGVATDDNVMYAAKLEKRRRDTESALGKTRQTLKTEESLRKKLETRVASSFGVTLTPDKADEMEALLSDDPEAWRVEMNRLEQEAASALQEELTADRTAVSHETELERRQTVLTQFNLEHPDVPITDELLANDIPPRISNRLANGEVTFEEFLTEAYNFMTRPVKIGSATPTLVPNLGLAGGGSAPSATATDRADATDYNNTTF